MVLARPALGLIVALLAALPFNVARGALLFTSNGYTVAFRNSWTGWYKAGGIIKGSNVGKTQAYDTVPLAALRFETKAGTYVEYQLKRPYLNKTLLEIVHMCMGDDRMNTGTTAWVDGHCSVGTLTGSAGIPKAAARLRIGVGDNQSDSQNWALFLLQDGYGASSYAVGSKGQMNNAYSGQLYIYGIPHDAPGRGMFGRVTSPCSVDPEGCVRSPDFPLPYGNFQYCIITINQAEAGPMSVPSFATEHRHDLLTVNGRSYSGNSGPRGVVPKESITWSSDGALKDTGWKLCPSAGQRATEL